MTPTILALGIRDERDVVLARQRARHIAELLGFDRQDQIRIATAVSEIARNTFAYAGGGTVEFRIEGRTVPQVFFIRISDRGPGIADLAPILEGRYRSTTGMGLGIIGARRLMDQFDIDTAPGRGTTIVLKKLLPRRSGLVDSERLGRLGEALACERPRDPLDEVQLQNQELLQALADLQQRQEELLRLNQELEDTNRGVVALYAELDEKADHLRRADGIKSRFLSNMSHEFRTPVNSIQALSRLLLGRVDGDLTPEQEKQVSFIRKAADDLSELVNDLLDLAKVEAGKTVVSPVEFEVGNLFGALRGMLRPLLVNESVRLVFDEPDGVPMLHTDEAKVSQVLRNFISNALKFTERGEVRVSARLAPGEVDSVAFSVADTGIGIAPEDQEPIFQEFTQVEHPLQRRVKGTGLGLPLCRKLAGLLGGAVSVESQPGVGSTFTVTIPTVHAAALAAPGAWERDPGRMPVLVVEDGAETMLVYEKFLGGTTFQLIPARSLREAREALAAAPPVAIVLDIMLKGEDGWGWLVELKRQDATRDIPVLIVSTVDDVQKGLALGADSYCVKPIDQQRLLETLAKITAPRPTRRLLLVDDEEVARYLLRRDLGSPFHHISEAANAAEALHLARAERPDVIFLDLVMPGANGLDVLDALKTDPATRDIPVVIVTSKRLDESERRALLERTVAVLDKGGFSREEILATLDGAAGTPGHAG